MREPLWGFPFRTGVQVIQNLLWQVSSPHKGPSTIAHQKVRESGKKIYYAHKNRIPFYALSVLFFFLVN